LVQLQAGGRAEVPNKGVVRAPSLAALLQVSEIAKTLQGRAGVHAVYAQKITYPTVGQELAPGRMEEQEAIASADVARPSILVSHARSRGVTVLSRRRVT